MPCLTAIGVSLHVLKMASQMWWHHYIFSFSNFQMHEMEKGQSLCLGVVVKTGGKDIEILASVISNIGMFSTFKKILTPEIQENPSK